MQQEPFEKRAHDDDNVFPAKIASSRRRIGSGPAFLVSASHYTPRRQALSQSRTRRETNGAFVHVQERKLYGEGGRSCFWALREAHRKPIVRDLRVVVGAERAGKAFRECHRCQTSSAEASSNASSSATTTTARKQRNPRRRGGGGDTAAAAAAASRAAAAHLATQWVRFLFLQPLLIRHALRKTKDVVLAEPPSGVSFPALLRALLRRPFVLAWGGRVIRDAIGDRCSVRYGWLYGRGGPPVSPAPRLPGDTTRVQKRRLPKSTGDHPVR